MTHVLIRQHQHNVLCQKAYHRNHGDFEETEATPSPAGCIEVGTITGVTDDAFSACRSRNQAKRSFAGRGFPPRAGAFPDPQGGAKSVYRGCSVWRLTKNGYSGL